MIVLFLRRIKFLNILASEKDSFFLFKTVPTSILLFYTLSCKERKDDIPNLLSKSLVIFLLTPKIENAYKQRLAAHDGSAPTN